jgi:hypothetical protein
MRRRRSTSASSGKLIEKGRIAAALVATRETPWFEGWASASRPEVTNTGNRLTAPTVAEVARKFRRVRPIGFGGMIILHVGLGTGGGRISDASQLSVVEDDPSGA